MSHNYAVVDVETTGLNPTVDALLEIAVVVVDTDLNVISSEPFHAIVRYSERDTQAWRTNASPYVRDMHDTSGLWDKVSGPEATRMFNIDANLTEWLALYGAAGTMPVMGNSPRLDMNFMEANLPKASGFLDYHMRDVSTVAGLATDWYGVPPYPKAKSHEALADVLECIEELRYYRALVFREVL